MTINLPEITKGKWTARKGDTLNPDRPWGIVRVFTLEECQEIDGDDAVEGERSEVILEVCAGPTQEADAIAAAAVPQLLNQLEECRAFISELLECKEIEALWDLVANNAEAVEGRAEKALLSAGCTIEN